MDEAPPPGALAGIRVISTGQILAAPHCSTLLAEFGADVIKVEQRRIGDPNRDNLSFEQDNRGQRSVTLDLHQEAGRGLFRRLCDTADVLVENFRPGTLERWGLAPDFLRETNPGLVTVRISGYGQTGPYRDRPAFDRVALAFSGITYVTGDPSGPPSAPVTSSPTMAPASTPRSALLPPSRHASTRAAARTSTSHSTRLCGG